MTHPLQTAAWANFRKAMGVDIVKLSEWFISFHRIPYTPFTIGFFPKGPNPTKKLIEELVVLGKQKRALFIQIEPNETTAFNLLPPSHHPLFTKYTFIIDLTKTEEELLSAMHPKTRYNIKVAQKHNVKIQEDNSDVAFETYIKKQQIGKDFTHTTNYIHEPCGTVCTKQGLLRFGQLPITIQLLRLGLFLFTTASCIIPMEHLYGSIEKLWRQICYYGNS